MERSWSKKIDEVDASLSLVTVPVSSPFAILEVTSFHSNATLFTSAQLHVCNLLGIWFDQAPYKFGICQSKVRISRCLFFFFFSDSGYLILRFNIYNVIVFNCSKVLVVVVSKMLRLASKTGTSHSKLKKKCCTAPNFAGNYLFMFVFIFSFLTWGREINEP